MSDSLENHLKRSGFSKFHHLSVLRTWLSKSLLTTCKSILRYLLIPGYQRNEIGYRNSYQKVNLFELIMTNQDDDQNQCSTEKIFNEIVKTIFKKRYNHASPDITILAAVAKVNHS